MLTLLIQSMQNPMNFEIVYLIWAVIVTVLLTVLGFLIIKLRQKHDSDIQKIKKVIEPPWL
mgnify:CR=1 FL=1